MANNSRRRRHRLLALAAAGAVSVVVALVSGSGGGDAAHHERRRAQPPPPAAQPPIAQPTSTPAAPKKPRPEFQDASCPDVLVLSVPGTWESSAAAGPAQPCAVPEWHCCSTSLVHLPQQFGDRPHRRPTRFPTPRSSTTRSADNQMSYNDSRAEGMTAAVKAITDMTDRCPLTSYVIVGFSQGAVIAGDIAGDIGNGKGPGRRGPGAGGDVDRRRAPRDRRGPGHRPEPAGAGRRDHAARGAVVVGLRLDDDRPAARRPRRAERPHLRDLRGRAI